MANQVFLERKESPASLVNLDVKGHLAKEVPMVYLDSPELKENPVIKAEMDLLDEKASLEYQVLKAMLVYLALLVCLEEKVTLVHQEFLERRANKDYLACLEKEALMDILELRASLVSQDSQDLLDLKDLKEW